jgi:hypothetical protein
MMAFILSVAAAKPSAQTCIHVLSNFTTVSMER